MEHDFSECSHGIAIDSFCNACHQAMKLDNSQADIIKEGGISKLFGSRRLSNDAAAVMALYDAALSCKRQEPILDPQALLRRSAALALTPEPVSWRKVAAECLLKQAEANLRILHLESVLADILDGFPVDEAEIRTAIYPQAIAS